MSQVKDAYAANPINVEIPSTSLIVAPLAEYIPIGKALLWVTAVVSRALFGEEFLRLGAWIPNYDARRFIIA